MSCFVYVPLLRLIGGSSIMLYLAFLSLAFRLPRAPIMFVRLPSIVAVLPSFPTTLGLGAPLCWVVPRCLPSVPILRVSRASRALVVWPRSPSLVVGPARFTTPPSSLLGALGLAYRTLFVCCI